MTTTYHTPITTSSYANAAVYNAPLAELDAAIGAAITSAVAIATANDIDVLDAQLRWWGRSIVDLLSDVTESDYSDSQTLTDGTTIYAGSIHKQATVTWPDDSSGHCDAVEYPDEADVLQYWTASHDDSGKIVVMDTDGTITVVTPDYYVDSAADPGGDGTLATPYDSVSDLPSLTSGDVVAIKSDSYWRERWAVAAGVSVYRYGTGDKPCFDGADIITETWTNDGTYTNLWYIDVTPEDAGAIAADGGPQAVLFIDGDFPTSYQTSLADCNANEDSFHVPDETANPQRVYYYPAASNPNDDGRLYEFASRGACINAGAGVTLDGIHTTRNRGGGGSLKAERNAVLRHYEASYGNKHNALFYDGAKLYGCKFLNAFLTTSPTGTLTVYNENTPASLGVQHLDCAFDSGRSITGLTLGISGANGHHNTSGDFGLVIYQRCHFNQLLACITAGTKGFTTATIEYCVLANTKTALYWNNLVEGGTVIAQYNIKRTYSEQLVYGPQPMTYYIRNNYAYSSGGNGVVQVGGAGTWYIYDNEFVRDTDAPGTNVRGIQFAESTTATVTVYDNRWLGTKDGTGTAGDFDFYVYSVANPTPRIRMDRNIYGNNTKKLYFPEDSFDAAVSTFNGTALANVSGLNGTGGDGSQEANATIYS